jgi:integrase
LPRAKSTLTNDWVAGLKAATQRKEVKVLDFPGLRVAIQPSGQKSFVFRYSHDGRYRKATLGQWPGVSLVESADERAARLAANPKSEPVDAVTRYRLAKVRLAEGVDPGTERIAQRRERAAKAATDESEFAFRARWGRFLDRPHKRTGGTKRASSRRRYETAIGPVLEKWGSRDVRNITKADCDDVLSDAAARGRHAQATLFMVLNGFFSWLEKHDVVHRSPMKSFDRIAAKSNKTRVLTFDDLKAVWKASDQLGIFGAYVKVLALTAQRRMEIAALRFDEINFEKKLILLPGKRTKNGQDHIVHLSDAAMAILESMPRIGSCAYVFTSDGETHLKGFSKLKDRLDKLAPIAAWTLHDLRRTFSTRAAENGIPALFVEKILNHQKLSEQTEVARIYNLYAYDAERRQTMDKWAAMIARAVEGGPADNVVPLRA